MFKTWGGVGAYACVYPPNHLGLPNVLIVRPYKTREWCPVRDSNSYAVKQRGLIVDDEDHAPTKLRFIAFLKHPTRPNKVLHVSMKLWIIFPPVLVQKYWNIIRQRGEKLFNIFNGWLHLVMDLS
jgi:hypothetical protein